MKPILFNTDMVRAILEGRKTVTRRVVKPQPRFPLRQHTEGYHKGEWHEYSVNPMADKFCNSPWGARYIPHYHPGDILYVREAFQQNYDGSYSYRAGHKFEKCGGWHPSIHMPREAARIFLRVTNVSVAKLQDITEEQARSEGVLPFMVSMDVDKPDNEKEWHEVGPALPGFMSLWNSTIKKSDLALYGWDANPWVWVIEFDRISREEAVNHAVL